MDECSRGPDRPGGRDSGIDAFGSYLPWDRRLAEAEGRPLPERTRGSALFADISGFTPLTTALTESLGLRRGAEELPRHLNRVYDALIEQVHALGGTVIGFSGDAITCWFDGDDGRSAVACALRMQRAMEAFENLPMPDGTSVSLAVKVAVSRGAVRRFAVGDPTIQRIDVIAGDTVSRLAEAEGAARRGEVLLDEETATALNEALTIHAWRGHGDVRVAVVESSSAEPPGRPAAALADMSDAAGEAILRPWLLPTVFERLQARQGEFLTELRPATALFLSFTGIDYDGDDSAGDKLDAFVRWVQAEANRLEGTLIQLTIGDKGSYLYLSFGAPRSHEDDAVRAATVALVLKSPPARLGFVRDIRIGMSVGTMRTGAYGGTHRRTYGALGNATNMAARLMGKAEPGQILATEAFHRAAADAFAWKPLPPVMVKGRSEPLPVFELTASRVERRGALADSVVDAPMIGRREELGLLLDRLAGARGGRGRIVGVTADAGMGKSRLIAETVTHARGMGATVLGGACHSYDTVTPYAVWRGIYRSLLDIDPALGPEAQIAQAAAALSDADASLLARLPLMGPVLDLSIADTDLTRSLDADLVKASREALLVDVLRRGAQRPAPTDAPLVLVIQDLHWMDPLSRDLLEAISRVLHDLPVLVLASYRPGSAPAGGAPFADVLDAFEEIELRAFAPDEAEALVDAKLGRLAAGPGGGLQLSAELRKALSDRAEGNPFFLDELLNYLVGLAADEPGDLDAEAIAWPANLHSLILSRIDKLTERQKATLKVASVVGRVFRVSWLCGYHPSLGSREEVEAELEALRRADLTPLDTPDPLAYLFKHVITQDVTYESIAFQTRAQLHERLARFIEATLASDAEPYVDLLAFHYERSENDDKKREYLWRAGETAHASYANDAAISWFSRLLPLVDDAKRVGVLLRLGQVATLLGRYVDAAADLREALILAERLGDTRAAARCKRVTGELFEKKGDFAEALTWLEGAKVACEALEDRGELVQVLLALGGNVLWRLGEYTEAEEHLRNALALTEELEDARAKARTLHGLGNLDLYRGNHTAATTLFEQSLAIRREIGDRLGVANALNNLGILAANAGDASNARSMFEESLSIRREIGDRAGIAIALNNLGFMASDGGDVIAARSLYQESLMLRREIGDRLGMAISLNNLAHVSLTPADAADAERLYREGLAIAYDIGSKREAASSLAGLAAATILSLGSSVEPASRPDAGAEDDPVRSAYVRAVRNTAAAESLLASIGAAMEPEIRRLHDSTLAIVRAALGEATVAEAAERGRTLRFEQVVRDALGDGR